jgi:sulfate adenylyltransferase subunit 2
MKEIIDEMTLSDVSERNTRVIDFDGDSSMEQKKREGYF